MRIKSFIRVISGIVLMLIFVILLFLNLGNRNWHRAIYEYQIYMFPKRKPELRKPPSNYTGKWVFYSDNGGQCERYYINGFRSGIWQWYDKNGFCYRTETYKNGKIHGMCKHYSNGALASFGIYKSGLPWYGALEVINPDDCMVYVEKYVHGKRVSDDEYEIWKKKTGGVDNLLKNGSWELE